MVNPFTKISSNDKWVLPVSALSGILGFMLVGAWLTKETRNSRYMYLTGDQRSRVAENVIDLVKYQQLQSEVDTLRKKETTLEKAISDNSKGSKALNDQLQDAKVMAGLTELEGPGVKVTLRDNTKAGPMPQDADLIHDIDVLRVTNELFSAGAEAISVNGQRLVATSSVRCAGPTILVDDVKVTSPFVILAIGNQTVLYNSFTMTGGMMAELASASPTMVAISKEDSLRIPAYLGVSTMKFGVVPKEQPKQ
ncbi:MAG: DUF881 domain-containing protein [Armatimonadetes bacterium]|nr:DUF881 domain-containing protein [Armatimonadota bacterium]MBS1704084.1 DUF881 domain-containing protein [Armatimonadota bacterium]MBS1725572.1 DUF881 domain-containing protein [Armatimonadota bacterium]